MLLCYECSAVMEPSIPHGDVLPPYCPRCLHMMRIRVVRDLHRWGILDAYKKTVEVDRYPHPSECQLEPVIDGPYV